MTGIENRRYGRDRMAKTSGVCVGSDMKATVAFAAQIFLAYMLMVSVGPSSLCVCVNEFRVGGRGEEAFFVCACG